LADLNCKIERDWLIELSDNKLPDTKLSDNNLAGILKENKIFFKPVAIEKMLIVMIVEETTSLARHKIINLGQPLVLLTIREHFCSRAVCISLAILIINYTNNNFLDCDWFKKSLFSTNSLAKLLSVSLLLDI